jgi:hypothetical protein
LIRLLARPCREFQRLTRTLIPGSYICTTGKTPKPRRYRGGTTIRTILRERIPHTDPRLQRHILHDSESRRYEFDTTGLTIASVEHQRTLPILDQGPVGSCTAECGTGILGTAPYSGTGAAGAAFVRAFGSWDQAGAYRLYSAEETLDGDGPYPPNDQGSTGLTLAKTLRAAGCISGWTQTFSLTAALQALTVYPLARRTYWYNSMFDPSPEGVLTVDPASGIAGGHEYESSATTRPGEWSRSPTPGVPAGGRPATRSCRPRTGVACSTGRATSPSSPRSPPRHPPRHRQPGDPDDTAFAAALHHHDWIHHPHIADNAHVASAARVWLAKKGL